MFGQTMDQAIIKPAGKVATLAAVGVAVAGTTLVSGGLATPAAVAAASVSLGTAGWLADMKGRDCRRQSNRLSTRRDKCRCRLVLRRHTVDNLCPTRTLLNGWLIQLDECLRQIALRFKGAPCIGNFLVKSRRIQHPGLKVLVRGALAHLTGAQLIAGTRIGHALIVYRHDVAVQRRVFIGQAAGFQCRDLGGGSL